MERFHLKLKEYFFKRNPTGEFIYLPGRIMQDVFEGSNAYSRYSDDEITVTFSSREDNSVVAAFSFVNANPFRNRLSAVYTIYPETGQYHLDSSYSDNCIPHALEIVEDIRFICNNAMDFIMRC